VDCGRHDGVGSAGLCGAEAEVAGRSFVLLQVEVTELFPHPFGSIITIQIFAVFILRFDYYYFMIQFKLFG